MLTLLAGCSGSAPGESLDAGEHIVDASSIERGVHMEFALRDFFPKRFDTNGYTVNVKSAAFYFQDLRLIGDSATGDDRVSKSMVELRWKSDTTVGVSFPDAPSGIYSRIRGTLIRVEMNGDVEIPDSGDYQYSIEHGVSIPIDFDLSFTLESGTLVTLPTYVKLKQISDAFWKGEVEVSEGVVEVEIENTNELNEAVADSFGIEG